MSLPHKFGTLSPVIYFQCSLGHVVMAPYSDLPTPRGCEFQAPITGLRCGAPCVREGADSLPAIDRLQRLLSSQENEKLRLEGTFDAMQTEAGRQRVRDRLYDRLISSSTPEAEKDFIRAYLNLREEKMREKYHARFAAYNVYVHAREFDLGKKREDQEAKP